MCLPILVTNEEVDRVWAQAGIRGALTAIEELGFGEQQGTYSSPSVCLCLCIDEFVFISHPYRSSRLLTVVKFDVAASHSPCLGP